MPLIPTALFASYHSGYAISMYIAACAVVSIVATAMMPNYITGQHISMEYDD
jgi:general stress protein CsbA